MQNEHRSHVRRSDFLLRFFCKIVWAFLSLISLSKQDHFPVVKSMDFGGLLSLISLCNFTLANILRMRIVINFVSFGPSQFFFLRKNLEELLTELPWDCDDCIYYLIKIDRRFIDIRTCCAFFILRLQYFIYVLYRFILLNWNFVKQKFKSSRLPRKIQEKEVMRNRIVSEVDDAAQRNRSAISRPFESSYLFCASEFIRREGEIPNKFSGLSWVLWKPSLIMQVVATSLAMYADRRDFDFNRYLYYYIFAEDACFRARPQPPQSNRDASHYFSGESTS